MPYTADQLLGAIAHALAAKDMPAVADLVRALAAVSPRDAQVILDALDLAKVAG